MKRVGLFVLYRGVVTFVDLSREKGPCNLRHTTSRTNPHSALRNSYDANASQFRSKADECDCSSA